MITALLMDADGVLVNGQQFSKVLARDFEVDHAKEQEFFTTIFQDCLIGKADLKEAITPYLTSFGWKGSADELLDYWFKAEHSLNNELISYIQNLRQQGVFSAQPPTRKNIEPNTCWTIWVLLGSLTKFIPLPT